MSNNQPTASLVIIGNEILSGRTEDKHLKYLADQLTSIGIKLKEVIVIPDIEEKIIEYINKFRVQYNYVLTTGGIGPTHDDVTTSAVARAFKVKLERNKQAVRMLEARYKERNTKYHQDALKMADIPQNAQLILNPISGAPGFIIENVCVLAGIPSVMQAMFQYLKDHYLVHGSTIFNRTITIYKGESHVSSILQKVQNAFPILEVGSYPFIQDKKWCTQVVISGYDQANTQNAVKFLISSMEQHSIKFHEESK